MQSALTKALESSVAERFQSMGYLKTAFATYLRSDDQLVWRGLYLRLQPRRSRILVEPYLCAFCPKASQIIEQVSGASHRRRQGGRSYKFGNAMIYLPLYSEVNAQGKGARFAFSYGFDELNEVNKISDLICGDFHSIEHKALSEFASVESLRDFLLLRPINTSASINLIALSFILDPDISLQEVDKFADINPSLMTSKFVTLFKKNLRNRNSAPR